MSVPSTVWGTDITYISTDEGWLYLAGVKDFASREIVGYAMGGRMTTELVQRCPEKGTAIQTAAAGLHSPFRPRKPVLCGRLSQGGGESGNDRFHVAKGKLL